MWIVFGTLAVIVLAILVVLGTRPMKIPREPWREGPQEGEAVRAYDRTSGWPVFIVERHIILGELKKLRPGGSLVDIGCGPGHLAARIARSFSSLNVTGLDISPEMIDIAKKRWPPSIYSRLNFMQGDARQLPFPESSVDFIVSALSLHHWAGGKTALEEVYRVLKPGGQFFVFDLKRDSQRWFYYLLKTGQAIFAPKAIKNTNGAVGSYWSSYTVAELKAMLSGIPFSDLQVKGRFAWMSAYGGKPGKQN
jgi:ubiquinone/menaquinone biosynthesis C-methylase UbiE